MRDKRQSFPARQWLDPFKGSGGKIRQGYAAGGQAQGHGTQPDAAGGDRVADCRSESDDRDFAAPRRGQVPPVHQVHFQLGHVREAGHPIFAEAGVEDPAIFETRLLGTRCRTSKGGDSWEYKPGLKPGEVVEL